MDGGGPVTVARRLLVVCVDDYKDSDASFRSDLAAQVGVVAGWLTSTSLPTEHQFSVRSPERLKTPRDLREFMLAEDLTEAKYNEALVVYITGHGVEGASGRHYLTFSDTGSSRLMATAFPTSELIGAVMDSEAEHILVLVDSCFAGTLDLELKQMLRDLSAARRKLPTIAVVTSGHFDEEPHAGEFTAVVARTLAKIADESSGYSDSHLSFEEWERLLKTVGEESPGLIEALWVWPASRRHVPSACLPNPGYRPPPTAVGAAVAELALAGTALERYWISRASGQAGEDDTGWYFSGRADLVRAMIGFLGGGSGALVVTGAAGSGKSALLARLVTLTDPTFLGDPGVQESLRAVPADLLPPAGSVHAAVLARGKTALALIEDLLTALGARPAAGLPPLQLLLAHLRTAADNARETLTIVIDGLDEAEEPLACISDVVLPMGRVRRRGGSAGVRLVLGVRSSLPSPSPGGGGDRLRDDAADQLLGALHTMAAGDGAEREVPLAVLRTDEESSSTDAIALYVRAMLTGPADSPYRDEPQAAAAAADVIATAVQPSFLDARLAADQLRSAERTQDLTDEAWNSRLLDGTAALLREDIRAVAAAQDVDGHLLLAVLRATAFAPGSGLPWAEVWPAATRAVLGALEHGSREVVDRAIAVFRHSRLVGYLASGQEDGRVTYRPVHQRITETLISSPHSLLAASADGVPARWQAAATGALAPAAEVQERLTVEFAALARASRPFPAHPYVRRHLLEHADAGGVLDDAHVPVDVLVHETSQTLRSRLGLPLPTDDPARRHLTAAALVEPYLDEMTTASSRADSIAFHNAALGGEPPDLFPHGQGPAVRTRWAQWEARPNVLASPQGTVHVMCAFAAPDGRPLIAAATGHGTSVWDIASGHSLTRLPGRTVHAMRPIRGHSGRVFLVTANLRQAAVWDPLSGRKVASLTLKQRVSSVQVLADGEQRWRVALVTSGGVILWSPTEDAAETIDIPGWSVRPHVAAVRPDGRRSALVFATDHGLQLWDPREPQAIRTLRGAFAPVRSMVALPGTGGDLVAVAHGDTPHVSMWSCEDGTFAGSVPTAAQRLAVMTWPDREPILVTENHGLAELWASAGSADRPRQRLGEVYVGDVHAIAGVPQQATRGSDEGRTRPRLATAGEEGIRLWAPGQHQYPSRHSRDFPHGPTGTALPGMLAVVPSHIRSSPDGLLVTGTPTGFDLHDAATGHRVRQVETGAPTVALRVFPSPAPDGLLTSATRARIQTWDLHTGLLKDSFELRNTRTWTTFVLPDGSPALLVAEGGHLYVRNVTTAQDWSVDSIIDRRPSSPRATSLLVLPPDKGRVLAAVGTDRSVEIWDLASDSPVNRLRPRHPGRVSAMTLMAAPHSSAPLLAIATAHGIHLWDTLDWTQQAAMATSRPRALVPVAAPGGDLLAYGNGTGVHLWDGLSDTPVHSLLTAAPVLSIATMPAQETQNLYISGPAGTAALPLR
ncbi:AAA family ATPase [Kitasatospora herbaricolor]|uniref:AAA family ATPase n=1 Tax=Kitasatospora herbaricolor TaxID=68217 RepID=UPI0036D8FC05